MESRSSEIPYPFLLQLEFDKFKGILRTLAIRIYFADFDSSFVENARSIGTSFFDKHHCTIFDDFTEYIVFLFVRHLFLCAHFLIFM